MSENTSTIIGATSQAAAPVSLLTIINPGGVDQNLVFQLNSLPYGIANGVVGLINGSLAGGSVIAAEASSPASVPAGKFGMLRVRDGGFYAVGIGYTTLIDSATAATTVAGGAAVGQLVVAGSGDLVFSAGLGIGTVIAGGGNNLISVQQGAGNQVIYTGEGVDTILATSGQNNISMGVGSNTLLIQGGDNTVFSVGDDLISAPDGNAKITLSRDQQYISGTPLKRHVFLGRGGSTVDDQGFNPRDPSTIVVGSGAATIRSTGGDQIWMQVGGGVVESRGLVLSIAVGDSPVPVPIVTVVGSYGADTIIGGTGAITVNAIQANDFVFAGPGALNFVGGQGASTILGNAQGTATITGGAGSVVAIAYGQTSFTGGAGAATIAAFGGSVTIHGGSGTGLFVGAAGGNNRITAGTGNTTIYGGGTGDVLAAGSVGGGILVAGSGAETLIGGAGADLFAVIQGKVGNLVVQNFTKGQDFFTLSGFATNEATNALASAVTIGGSQHLTLSDGTKILFAGVTGLGAGSFI